MCGSAILCEIAGCPYSSRKTAEKLQKTQYMVDILFHPPYIVTHHVVMRAAEGASGSKGRSRKSPNFSSSTLFSGRPLFLKAPPSFFFRKGAGFKGRTQGFLKEGPGCFSRRAHASANGQRSQYYCNDLRPFVQNRQRLG